MQTVEQGPVRAQVVDGELVDWEIVCACSRAELQTALESIHERLDADELEEFLEETRPECPWLDDPDKLLRTMDVRRP